LVSDARKDIFLDALTAGLEDDKVPLDSGGSAASAYADAVATYLALAVSKLADAQSSLARWKPSMDQAIATFGRQALPMVWDYAESNTFNGMAGDYYVSLNNMMRVVSDSRQVLAAQINHIDAARNTFLAEPIIVSTDPPYYDNIGYADLSDYFYVWLKRSLANIWPELFRRLTTPKAEELVATPSRHGGKDEAEAFFMEGMGKALTAMSNAAVGDAPLVIYYAYKQSEIADEGIFSAGWTSFLQSVVNAGLAVDGTWPVRTELANRMIAKDANALASSIVLVCRKRNVAATVVPRAEFIRAMKRELPMAIDNIRMAGVGPVDMQQSVIGPGMGVFSRYSKVLEDDDSTMSVRTALSLINRVWEEIENELETNFDPETQVALAWFATYGFDAKPSGELITLANAKNVPLGALFASGVFSDGRGKAGLTARSDLPVDWSPASDKALTVWECVQHTARVLNAKDGGGVAAAGLVAEMGPKAADARTLAYRLYEIASQKGWAAEALIYNELAQEWPKLEELASTSTARNATADTQALLL
jgi:putative DNA methylase